MQYPMRFFWNDSNLVAALKRRVQPDTCQNAYVFSFDIVLTIVSKTVKQEKSVISENPHYNYS